MSIQEKRNIVSIVSSLVIFGFYSMYVYGQIKEGGEALLSDFSFWGSAFLILIPITIVAKIVIFILFAIGNAIATREEEPDITDERDKLIGLKASRISHYVFILGFLLSMGSQALGMPPFVMFIILAASGFVSDIAGDISQIYFYRRGV